jgi:hypothetical protein
MNTDIRVVEFKGERYVNLRGVKNMLDIVDAALDRAEASTTDDNHIKKVAYARELFHVVRKGLIEDMATLPLPHRTWGW